MTKELLNEIENDYWNEKADPIDMAEVFDLANKALEQQPCEDCISREELRKLICQNNDKYGYSDRFHEFTEQCLQLPSVTPQPKTGEWRHYERTITCSECDTEFYDDIMEYCGDDVPRFCPHCGARMNGLEGDTNDTE